jgi:hypothetical protein
MISLVPSERSFCLNKRCAEISPDYFVHDSIQESCWSSKPLSAIKLVCLLDHADVGITVMWSMLFPELLEP